MKGLSFRIEDLKVTFCLIYFGLITLLFIYRTFGLSNAWSKVTLDLK